MGRLSACLPTALAPTRAALPHSATPSCSATTRSLLQVRHATLIPRPRRPYTFTQLVQLTDGSTYTVRSTSPQPIYRAVKDTRNTLMWQPSEDALRNVELDEAGKLAAFRERFGRGFDASQAGSAAGAAEDGAQDDGDLADLMAEYAPEVNKSMRDSGTKKTTTKRK